MLDPASNLALGAALAVLGLAAGWYLRGRRRAGERNPPESQDLVVAHERERSLAYSAKASELGLGQRVARLEQDLGIRSAQVASLREETARLAKIRHDLEARLAKSQEELAARGEDLATAQARLKALEAGAGPDPREVQDTPRPSLREVAAPRADDRLAEHLQALEQKLRETTERAAGAAAAHAAALREERAARDRLQGRLAELERSAGRLRDLELQLSDSERRRTDAVHDLDTEVRRLRARAAELEAAVRQRDDLERALQTREDELRRHAERIRELEALQPERERRVALEAETTTLRSLLAERDREVETLRAVDRPSPARRPSLAPASALASRRRNRQTPPGERDDLKRIHGIGPALERRLHRLGITRFGQIASWTGEDIARIARELADSADRIRRDGWVQSARREYTRKYGQDPLTGERAAEKA
jgi:predicted flap endonuclease-1-like 5' DNA nuclease